MVNGNMKTTKIAPQICAAFSVTVILTAVGFHCGWVSPMLPKLLEDAIAPVTLDQSSWVVSFATIGCTVSPLISVATIDRWGRKTSILLTSVPFLISCILFAFAQNYWWYYAGRFLCGYGIGIIFTTVPIYIGEIVEDKIRGGIGILITVMLNLGFLLPYGAGPWVSRQVLAAIGGLIPIVYVLTFSWMPETPYYHFMKNKPEKARKSLEWLRGTTHVAEEAERIKKNVEFELKNKGTLKELFSDKGNRKALLMTTGQCAAQQFSGSFPILAYSTMIFEEAATGVSSSVSVIITGVVQLVASIVVVFLADRAGRRTLLLSSMFFSTIFLIGEGVYFHLKANGNDVSGISWLPVTAIVGYLCSYSLGMGTVPLSLISEMFPCNVKAYATAISITSLAACATLVVQLYPLLTSAYGMHASFYFFAVCTMLSMIFTLYLPETKGKSLGEIQDMLQGRHGSKLKPLKPPVPNTCAISKSPNSITTIA